MEMSSSNPVRSDPLPDWLQPFDENLVDEEEQRGDRVEVHEDMQDDDQERKGVVAQGERARPLPQPRLPSRQEVQEHELTHIPYRSWCVHCVRGAGRSDAHRRRARQDEEEREQHMTTCGIDYAFMIDTGDLCTREEMERVGWDKTRDTVLVSEDLATGGIRAHLVSAKGNGDSWIAGKIKDDIEEFGYGGAPVRIKSDQEPAIVDVQRAVIAKRGNAPTIPVNSPVGDSQSNGRVENAIKKVRNMVKTILSSLESRWGIRVARDHPVYPWVFEWAADLMTRYAHVGDLGKTAVQLIRGSKSSRNIAQFGEKILYKPLKLSGHHRGNMEDTFLDGIFLGMRLRSDEILIGTARGVIKTRRLRRRVEEEQWDPEFAKSIKGEPRQPVPGINSDHVPAAISDRAGVHLEEDQPDARLAQQDEFIDPPEAREVSMPPDRLVTQVRSDTLKRMYVTRGLGKKYGPTPGCPGCATVGSHHQASHSDTCRDRMRAELEKSEEGREYLAREQARVDARKQEQSSSSSHKRAVSEEWDRPPEKFWRMGEEDVTMKQDITATSGASSSSASRGPAMDTESRPSRKRAADVQTEDLEDNEQLDADESAASLPQAEVRVF